MKGNEEKLQKIFWLRPAFDQKHSHGLKWLKSMTKRASLMSTLLVFFFIVLISLPFFAGWIDLAPYTKYIPQKTLTLSTPPPENYPLQCTTYNQTNTCPKNYPKSQTLISPNPKTCPSYFRWIHEDLKPWHQTGISQQTVEKAQKTAHFKLTIFGGKVYVEKFRPSIQTRSLFTIWGIVQLVRRYPGRLPDLEMMFDCDDRPVVSKNGEWGEAPPPVFRYCSDERSLDIVFPDWSFWGWAETNVKPWKSILKEIKEGNKMTKWEERVPYAYWKGNPVVAPWRQDLMTCNVTEKDDWNARLYVQDWIAESQQGYKQSSLGSQCTHRYKIYIEGWAWSVSEKYILACDSPTLLMTQRWYDFFIRGMIPQQHYWPVRDDKKCSSLKFAVDWGNNHIEKAKAIGEAGSHFIHEDMKMEYIYDYMFHLLNEYGKLMKYKPSVPPNAVELCAESVACPTDGIWRKFIEESLETAPSDSDPCTMPPPYEPQELKAFIDGKAKATKEVEAWENEYWDKQNRKP